MPERRATIDEVLDAIRTSGGRITPAKRALVTSLASGRHQTAEELTADVQRQVPRSGASTIYRNLEELEALGLVVHSHLGRAAAVYHLAGAVHGHLTCEQCGNTIEIPVSMFDDISRRARRDYGFAVDRHHLGVSGLCANCQG